MTNDQQTQGQNALPSGSKTQANGKPALNRRKPELVVERPAGADPAHPHELVIAKRPDRK